MATSGSSGDDCGNATSSGEDTGSLLPSAFKDDLHQLLEKTLSAKFTELATKEKELQERETVVNDYLAVRASLDSKVTIELSDATFRTTRRVLLENAKDSLFTAQLAENHDNADVTLFYPREGAIFKLVLEYCTYGKLWTKVGCEATLSKLSLDAEYYMLPELKAAADAQLAAAASEEEKLDEAAEHSSFIKLTHATGTAGLPLQWQQSTMSGTGTTACAFSHAGGAITVLEAGTYLVTLKVRANNYNNHTFQLQQGNAVAASFIYSKAQHPTAILSEVLQLNARELLQVTFTNPSYGASSAVTVQDPDAHFVVVRL